MSAPPERDSRVVGVTPGCGAVYRRRESRFAERAIRTSFKAGPLSTHYEVIELDVRGDRAYEIGRWMLRGLDGVAQRGGWYSWVWRRQPDGIWAIDRDVWSRTCAAQTAQPCP